MSENNPAEPKSQTPLPPVEVLEPIAAEMEEMLGKARASLAAITDVANSAKVIGTDSQRVATEANATIQTLLADINAVATQALAIKTQLLDAQTVIATKSDHIEGAREHADKVRAELDRTLTAATQQATEAEGLKTRAQTASDGATAFHGATQTLKGQAETEVAAVVAARGTCTEAATVLKGMSDKAATVEKRVVDYEARLADLEAQSIAQLKTITDLLPGATSAGLAYAFDDRRKTFFDPARRWQWVFVGSLILLIGLALSGMWHVYDTQTVITYDELGRLWLARLPVAAALVWLALHSSRESALAKRLEEDYGYKAAIASSFLGFNKQMADITTKVGENSPLSQLCSDTLDIIASPPGRIYEKHSLIVTPGNEIKDAATATMPKVVGS